MFKNADKILEKLGFEKVNSDSEYGANYRRKDKKYGYIQALDIVYKESGKHLIQSYVEEVNSEGFSNCVGLTYPEMKAAMKKYLELKRKYKW